MKVRSWTVSENSFHNLFFQFIWLNDSFYVDQDDVTDEKLMLEVQDSVSKTQMQVKKQKMSKEEEHTSKYNNYR